MDTLNHLLRESRQLSVIAAFSLALLCATSGKADIATEREQELLQRIEQLERHVGTLSDRLGEQWMNERRAEEVKQLVTEVLADADTRASLLADQAQAGYDGGFFIRSADDNFLLKLNGMIQARYIYGHRENSGEDDDELGLGISRTRYGFKGHVIDPSWKFVIWAGFACDGDALLLDATITKDFGNGLSFTIGQFKEPIFREFLVSETKGQMIERSLLTAECAGGYTRGIKLTYRNDKLHLIGSFNDGKNAINTEWNADRTDFGVTGRAEWLVFGDWKQQIDLESWRGEQPALLIGGAIHYEQGEHGTVAPEYNDLTVTADANLELGGGNIFGSFINVQRDDPSLGNILGFLVQGGYFVTDKIELVGRYEWADSDLGGVDDLSIATVGANYFVSKWQLRAGADVGYAFNPVNSLFASTLTGWQADAAGEDGQVVARLQVQILY